MVKTRYIIRKRTGELWSWKLAASNGKIIAEGSEFYSSKSHCIRAINSVRRNAKTYRIEEDV